MVTNKPRISNKSVSDQEPGGRKEKAEFRSDDTLEEVRDVFQAAAEGGPNDILKLYNSRKALVNISPKLPENTPDTPYQLDVIATQFNGTDTVSELGFDVNQLEQRLQRLEKTILVDNGETPHVVHDMKQRVDYFRQKLEHVDHLSWLGLYKDISSGTSLQPFWDKQETGMKTSHEHILRVQEKFIQISHVAVTDEVREYLKKPAFDNWQWDDSEMLVLIRQMYIDLDLITKFNIELSTLHVWLFEIYRHYNQVPFHNFKHCFMVTQMMYGLIWLVDLPKLVDDFDILILITSAICHDLDHPGYNNAYQINARTELALRYNDISPLENHHCSIAFEILEKEKCNIFRNLSTEQFKKVREGMIRCILATDMAKHSEILNKFKTIIHEFDFANKEHKALLVQILIKVSDISNEARPMEVSAPWIDCLLSEFFNQLMSLLVKASDVSNECRPAEVASLWAECLLQEFFRQSDVEKLEGLPVAPFMDRDKVNKPSSQVGFIKFVLLPLFQALAELFPVITKDILMPVHHALEYYQTMQDAMEEEKKRNDTKQGSASPTGEKNKLSSSNHKLSATELKTVSPDRPPLTLAGKLDSSKTVNGAVGGIDKTLTLQAAGGSK